MSEDEKKSLITIHSALNTLTVSGKQNLSTVIGCMNEIEKLIKGVGTLGDTNTEPKSN